MKKTKILAVDDDRGVTSICKRLLERDGRFEVREENLSDRACQSALEFEPDLILLDWRMPVMDGCEVVAQVRAHPELRGVPILVVSGYGDRSRKMGLPWLEKPVAAKSLLEAIDAELSRAATGSQAA